MKLLLLFLSLGLITSSAAYADLMEDFDSLGGNKDLLETAKALKPESKIQIVQDRVVNRFKRHEFSSEFNHVAGGGNPYFDTNSGGVSCNFHFNPHWSLGAKYYYYFNQLTTEGADKISKGLSRNRNRAPDEVGEAFIPDLNWPKQMYMANLNWYPIYGKMNVFDRGIVHFDVYTILGVGEV